MGTRGNVVVESDGKAIIRIYRQWDTYPAGMGADLQEIVGDPIICNGFGGDAAIPTHFNGMGCLAAYLVGELKTGIGSVYVESVTDEPDGCFIEYVYTLYSVTDPETKRARVHCRVETMHGGDPTQYPELAHDGSTFIATRYSYSVLYDGPLADMDPGTLEAS